MSLHKGKTSDAQSPIMGAKEWKKGTKVEGTIIREFETTNGTLYEVSLKTPLKLADGTTTKKVSLGNMAGMKMALNSCGLDHFMVNDKIILTCTGKTGTTKGNDRTDFDLVLDRPNA